MLGTKRKLEGKMSVQIFISEALEHIYSPLAVIQRHFDERRFKSFLR